MRSVTSLPHETRQDEHLWIPVSDGPRLAAPVWRPTGSDDVPVPAVAEHIPYRKRDLTAVRDSIHHPYIAGHGYTCARVDLRGTGESEGHSPTSTSKRAGAAGRGGPAGLADQPWCKGRTGMMGISWGAVAALQVAARRPPSPGAIVISSFTDDRYADDLHYMGS